MINILDRWDEVRRKLRHPEQVLWLFDFDGTLAPLARRPAWATLAPTVGALLRKLSRRFPRRVGVLSGRPLKQLRSKVGIPGLIYSGPHGFEIQGPGIRWTHPVPSGRLKELSELRPEIRRHIRAIPGMRIEDKKWTLAVHYRETRPKDLVRVAAILQIICNLSARSGFKVQRGLKALELLSDARWNKGQAVRRLRHFYQRRHVFYVGDDVTDETVFQQQTASDISVRVGLGMASEAHFFLEKQSQIRILLERLITL